MFPVRRIPGRLACSPEEAGRAPRVRPPVLVADVARIRAERNSRRSTRTAGAFLYVRLHLRRERPSHGMTDGNGSGLRSRQAVIARRTCAGASANALAKPGALASSCRMSTIAAAASVLPLLAVVECWIGVVDESDRRIVRLAGRLGEAQVPELLMACGRRDPRARPLRSVVGGCCGPRGAAARAGPRRDARWRARVHPAAARGAVADPQARPRRQAVRRADVIPGNRRAVWSVGCGTGSPLSSLHQARDGDQLDGLVGVVVDLDPPPRRPA